jgi:hypothetical protein
VTRRITRITTTTATPIVASTQNPDPATYIVEAIPVVDGQQTIDVRAQAFVTVPTGAQLLRSRFTGKGIGLLLPNGSIIRFYTQFEQDEQDISSDEAHALGLSVIEIGPECSVEPYHVDADPDEDPSVERTLCVECKAKVAVSQTVVATDGRILCLTCADD